MTEHENREDRKIRKINKTKTKEPHLENYPNITAAGVDCEMIPQTRK